MARAPIFAAGGIAMRGGPKPLIAVVQLRKDNSWMLPKGKLNDRENAIDAAKREVIEETGHDVAVQEFLGTMSYDVGKKPKIVQFWRMDASEQPVRGLMRDVKAVDWLPLEKAVQKLTYPREQAFLSNVGPVAIQSLAQPGRPVEPRHMEFAAQKPGAKLLEKIRRWVAG